ncbi:ABC transporter substrate-binding protein [Chloroflexota bacterium]
MNNKRQMIKWTCIALAVFLLAGLAFMGCGPAKPAQMTKIVIAFDWYPYGRQAPIFLAKDKGWFAEENIEFEYTVAPGRSVEDVANKTADFGQYTIASSVMLAVQAGMPITAICGEFQSAEYGFYGRQDMLPPEIAEARPRDGYGTIILEPQDLAGMTIGSSVGSQVQLGTGFLQQTGMADKTTIQVMDPGSKVGMALEGKIDSLASVSGTESYFDGLGGSWRIDFSKGGLGQFPGFAFAVHNDTIRDRPEVIKAFVRAYLKGLEYAIENPEEALNSLAANYPETNYDRQLHLLQICIPLLHTANTQGEPLGWLSEEDFELSQETLLKWIEGDDLTRRPVSEYFSNEFLP